MRSALEIREYLIYFVFAPFFVFQNSVGVLPFSNGYLRRPDGAPTCGFHSLKRSQSKYLNLSLCLEHLQRTPSTTPYPLQATRPWKSHPPEEGAGSRCSCLGEPSRHKAPTYYSGA